MCIRKKEKKKKRNKRPARRPQRVRTLRMQLPEAMLSCALTRTGTFPTKIPQRCNACSFFPAATLSDSYVSEKQKRLHNVKTSEQKNSRSLDTRLSRRFSFRGKRLHKVRSTSMQVNGCRACSFFPEATMSDSDVS